MEKEGAEKSVVVCSVCRLRARQYARLKLAIQKEIAQHKEKYDTRDRLKAEMVRLDDECAEIKKKLKEARIKRRRLDNELNGSATGYVKKVMRHKEELERVRNNARILRESVNDIERIYDETYSVEVIHRKTHIPVAVIKEYLRSVGKYLSPKEARHKRTLKAVQDRANEEILHKKHIEEVSDIFS